MWRNIINKKILKKKIRNTVNHVIHAKSRYYIQKQLQLIAVKENFELLPLFNKI